jgi:hypothetical protein
MGAPYDLLLPEEDGEMVVLAAEIPVVIGGLTGKHSDGKSELGGIVQLSQRQAVVRSRMELERFGNVTIAIEGINLIYGKVIDRSGERDCYLVRFTFLPDGILGWLREKLIL